MTFTPDAATALHIAKDLLEQPTAAMREQLPRRMIQKFVAARPGLTLSQDAAGNLIVRYEPKSDAARRRAPLVLVAHLDHPGFWVESCADGVAKLAFKGYVGEPHAHAGLRVRFFSTDSADPIGSGELSDVAYEKGRLVAATARVIDGRAPEGAIAMWDFPGFSIVDGKIVTRCCDDLLGASAALSALDAVVKLNADAAPVWGLFTRAEEIGFLGTLEAIRHSSIPKDACVLSLECSKAFDHAPQGGGVIVRVGDRSSIFDPQLTAALCKSAELIAKDDPAFKWQRKLMDGGSCEATAFCAYGFRASGVALPLGNYHNQAQCADGSKTIGPENVVVDDYLGEVRLLVELAQHPEWLEPGAMKLSQMLLDKAQEARVLTDTHPLCLE